MKEEKTRCPDPQHNPPKNLSAGVYMHICPKCGKQQVFKVKEPSRSYA